MSNLRPDAVFDSVSAIPFSYLEENNIKGILLDIDNTLIDMFKVMPDAVHDWVHEAKQKGYKVCVLTNTNNTQKLDMISEKLGIDHVSFAKKPSKSGYLRASKLLEIECKNLVMIGDQILTDVVGANKVGMNTIYVKPINKKEYWYTAWKRPIETLILKHYGYDLKG